MSLISLILSFIIGLIVGILANQVFAMLTRAVPQEWVRYKVYMGPPEIEKASGIANWLVPVTISPPPWYRRMFMSTLTEYLTVEVRVGQNDMG